MRRRKVETERPDGRVLAARRIALTAEGCAVPADHAAADTLLVGEGCEIEREISERYGLQSGDLPPDWAARLPAPGAG